MNINIYIYIYAICIYVKIHLIYYYILLLVCISMNTTELPRGVTQASQAGTAPRQVGIQQLPPSQKPTVEARKLERHYPHALKVKYKGS